MPDAMQDLFDAAVDAQRNAHCPYSNYPVGAAVRTASGRVFAGCNVENAAYPNGTCAEAGAIAAMALAGERDIVEVVTVTGGEVPGTPCGGCRQRIREFAGPAAVIVATTTDGGLDPAKSRVTTMAELLPDSFAIDTLVAARGARSDEAVPTADGPA